MFIFFSMKNVRVADLKKRLSEHLRKARSGRTVTVLNRNTPIARIVPYEDQSSLLTVRNPLPGAPSLKHVPLPTLRLRCDIVTLLLEERQGKL
jgi:prevent-host-death family protein